MTNILTDLLAIIGVVLNGLPQGLLALTFGFASIPTAMAFFIGAIGNTLTQSVAPISFQAETITYAGSAGKDRSERCTMIFFGAVIMALIGAFGLLTKNCGFHWRRHRIWYDGRCGYYLDESRYGYDQKG